MEKFIKIEIEASTSEEAEIWISLLSEIDFYAFEQNENVLIGYITQENFNEEKLKEILKQETPYTSTIIENRNWNKEWESQLQPVYINDFAGIRASFHEPLQNVRHEVIITPKMSFGTGHHATTHLMIEQMEKINFENKSVLDFGTGTGILGIFAEKLGASKVFAIDNDEWSISNAIENIKANECNKIIVQKRDDILGITQPDIILANINLNVLIRNARDIASISNKGALLLISGFLCKDDAIILNCFSEAGFVKQNGSQRGEWSAFILYKQ